MDFDLRVWTMGVLLACPNRRGGCGRFWIDGWGKERYEPTKFRIARAY